VAAAEPEVSQLLADWQASCSERYGWVEPEVFGYPAHFFQDIEEEYSVLSEPPTPFKVGPYTRPEACLGVYHKGDLLGERVGHDEWGRTTYFPVEGRWRKSGWGGEIATANAPAYAKNEQLPESGFEPLSIALWRDYSMYKNCVMALPLKCAKEDQKRNTINRLTEDGASCFWLSALSAIRPDMLNAFRRVYEEKTKVWSPCRGVNHGEALELCQMLKLGLYFFNPEFNVVDCALVGEKSGFSILQVQVDNAKRYRPHFLPMLRTTSGRVWLGESTQRHIVEAVRGIVNADRANVLCGGTMTRVEAPPPVQPVPESTKLASAPRGPVLPDGPPPLRVQNLFGCLQRTVNYQDPGWDIEVEGPARPATQRAHRASHRLRTGYLLREEEDEGALTVGVLNQVLREREVVVKHQPRRASEPIVAPPPPVEAENTKVYGEVQREAEKTELVMRGSDLPPEPVTAVERLPFFSHAYGEEAPPLERDAEFNRPTKWWGCNTSESCHFAVASEFCPTATILNTHGHVLMWLGGFFVVQLWYMLRIWEGPAHSSYYWDAIPKYGHFLAAFVWSGKLFAEHLLMRFALWWAFVVGGIALWFYRAWEGGFGQPRIFEARKSLLMQCALRSGDWLYVRVRELSHTNPEFEYSGGALQLNRLDVLECGPVHLKVGVPQIRCVDGRLYEVAALSEHIAAEGWFEKLISALCGYRYQCTRVTTSIVQDRTEQLLSELPTQDARLRTEYFLRSQLVPQDLKGIMNDLKCQHLGAEDKGKDVGLIFRQTCLMDKRVKSALKTAPAFAVPRRGCPKTCVSCGVEPPSTPYRWKHRTCERCAFMLGKVGYVSYAGSQVQQNLHVPTCYPGIVHVRGEQFPPSQSKWKDVCTEEEITVGTKKVIKPLVKISWHGALVKGSLREEYSRWEALTKFDLERLRDDAAQKFQIALAGIACSGARPMVSASTNYNKAKGLLGRVYRLPKEMPWGRGPKPGRWAWARQFVPELLPGFEAPKMDFPDWLATMPSRRRVALERAYVKYQRRGLMKSDALFKAFIKTEALPGFDKQKGCAELIPMCEMLDRLIQGPADVTHCIAGPVLKPLVCKLKKIWTCDSPIFYGSCGPEPLHRFLQKLVEGEAEYFWCDFKMFDNTHSADSWGFMEALYPKNELDFQKVLDIWRKPRGTIGPIKYRARIMNASGRDDTALANGILNGFSTYLSAAAALLDVGLDNLTVPMLRTVYDKILLSVCGDDSIGKIPKMGPEALKAFRERMDANIAEFGFDAKLEVSDKLYNAVYLGQCPYPTRSGWFWGKTIGRATYKMGWVLDPRARDVMAHVTGIADMHCLCSAHVPVLSDLARKIVDLRAGAKRTPVKLDPNRPWEWTLRAGVPYDDLTIAATAEMYSLRSNRVIKPADVQDLIGEIWKVESLPCVVDHWLWKLMIWSDDL
jgi:hypothetical protein